MINYEDVIVHPVTDGWVVVKPIAYRNITIEIGYYSNGANIPRILWVLIPPNNPDVFPAVMVHDYLCDKEQYVKADRYFEEILISSDVKKWKRKMIVAGVKFYTKYLRR